MKYLRYVLLCIVLFMPLMVYSLELPTTYSSKVLIYDLTDEEVLFAKGADAKTNIASLTKIMTTITAINNLESLTKKVTITDEMLANIVWDASRAGLKVGDIVTTGDLLYASILPSGADATQALAYETSGGIANFVAKMNSLASEIGMENSHFVNTTGLDIPNHYSTADDLLKLLKYALKNPTFRQVFTTKEYTLTNGLTVRSTLNLYNRNMHLDVSRILGSKTGFTDDAGLCMASLITSNNHEIIIITLNAPAAQNSQYYNLIDAINLTKFMDNNYQNVTIFAKNSPVINIPIINSHETAYEVVVPEDITDYLPVDYDKSRYHMEYVGREQLSFFDHRGDVIGKIHFYHDDTEIYTTDVILDRDFKVSVPKLFLYYKGPFIIGIVILLIIMRIILKKHKVKKRRRQS